MHTLFDSHSLAALDTQHKLGNDTVTMIQHCKYTVCSDLLRSLESAKVLGVKEINCVDAIFREFELPLPHERIPTKIP